MVADADARSAVRVDGAADGRDDDERPAGGRDGPGGTGGPDRERVVVRLELDAGALEHLPADGGLDADAARELAAVLDSYAAAVEE